MAVECLYGDKNLCELEVHSTFTIPAGGVLGAQSNIYDGAFWKKSKIAKCFYKNAPSQVFSWVLNTLLLVLIQLVQKRGFNMAVSKFQVLSHFD